MAKTKDKKYKVIFFDWNKTLSYSLFWNQLSDENHKHHHWHKNISKFLFEENKDLINQWMNGSVDEAYIVEKISLKFNYPKKTLTRYLAESCKNMELVSENILNKVEEIKNKGTKCVIATDNMDTFLKYTVPALKLDKYFDDFLVSFERRRCKFDPTDHEDIPFFDDYLRENNLEYSEVVLVDDSEDKTGVYKKLGFDIFKINKKDDLVNYLNTFAY